jgi:hypothetical protein
MKPILKITKNIETLRSYLVTRKQVDELIEDPPGDPSEEDKTSMEEFKKIFHIGKEQLDKFVSFITKGGGDLSEYSIMYYVTQLKNSPFYRLVKAATDNFKDPFWRNPPDILGVTGNRNKSDLQTDIDQMAISSQQASPPKKNSECGSELDFRSNYNNVTRHKVPYHVERNIYNTMVLTNDIQNINLAGLLAFDAYMSNSPGVKATSENAHGTYRVADIESWNATEGADAQGKIRQFLGADYDIYKYNKLVNPYSKSCNDSVENSPVKRKIPYVENEGSYHHPEGEVKVDKIVETDLTGDLYTSDDYMDYTVKIPLSSFHENMVQKEYKLHEFLGQFGQGVEPEEEPIND